MVRGPTWVVPGKYGFRVHRYEQVNVCSKNVSYRFHAVKIVSNCRTLHLDVEMEELGDNFF
jgi:hypothetical protein